VTRDIKDIQIRLLADRLAIAHSLALDCELDSFCNGDNESAKGFDQMQDYILGPNDDTWNELRREWRETGEYKIAFNHVKTWLTQHLLVSIWPLLVLVGRLRNVV